MCVIFSSRRRHTRCALVTGVHTCSLPICDGRPLLTGMPTRAEQIDAFEVALGRPVANLDYYAKLSGVRMSLVMARTVRNLIADGLLAPDNSGWLVNPASGVLAGMMGLADPGPNDDYMRVVAVMNRR